MASRYKLLSGDNFFTFNGQTIRAGGDGWLRPTSAAMERAIMEAGAIVPSAVASEDALGNPFAATMVANTARAALRAADKISLSRPALIRAAARQNSVTVAQNAIRRFSNNQLVVYTTGGQTAASEPTFTDTGPITDGAAVCYSLGASSLAVPDGVDVPTVTEGALASLPAGLTAAISPASNPEKFFEPLTPNVQLNGVISQGWLFNDGGTQDAYGMGVGKRAYQRAVEIETDSTRVAISSISGVSERYWFYVDDYLVEEDPTTITTTGSTRFLMLTFPTRKMRRIRICGIGSQPLRSVYVDDSAVIQPSKRDGLYGLWLGDSFSETVIPSTNYIADKFMAADVMRRLGIRYGFDMHIGGTGYVTTGAQGQSNVMNLVANNAMPVSDLAAVFVCHGFNDRLLTPAAVRANARATWQMLAERHPNATICVLGPWSGNRSADANQIAIDAAIQAEFQAWGYANSEFESPMTGNVISNGVLRAGFLPWTQGAGYVGAASGTGNSNIYTGTDSTHGSPAGRVYYGERCTRSFERMLRAHGL